MNFNVRFATQRGVRLGAQALQNPLNFHCRPNECAADVIAETDFERFIAYGFYRCWYDLSDDCFMGHRYVTTEDIQALREAFLCVVEGTLLFFWTGEFELYQRNFDVEYFGEACRVNIGNSDDGDEEEYLFEWYPIFIDPKCITFDLTLAVLHPPGVPGGDDLVLWLDSAAYADRVHVRQVIQHARHVNAYPWRTSYQVIQENKLWEQVLK